MKQLIYIVMIPMLLTLGGCAAYQRMEGDYHYEHASYQGAMEHYQKYLAKRDDPRIALRLADCYRRNSMPQHAAPLYFKAMSGGAGDDEDYIRYAQVLFSVNRAPEARPWLDRYLGHRPDDPLALTLMASLDSLSAFRQDTGYFRIQRMGTSFNAGGSNFSPAYYRDGLVFAGEREHSWLAGDAEWTGRDYLDLYYVRRDSTGKWGSAQRLGGEINSMYHEGSLCFTPDNRRVYFTRNDFLHGKRGHDDTHMNNLKLYKARVNDNGEWEDVEELGMSSDDYSVGHPALSPDGLQLYFVSDMPGGRGGTDLYVCSSLGADLWSAPRNLGPVLNTEGDEMFPYVAPDGSMYFSSNGHAGLGGLDIYRTQEVNGTWLPPYNMRHPVNSSMDDFGFITKEDVREGFLSSNRGSNEGLDRIFSFERDDPRVDLRGIVLNKLTHRPVGDAVVNMTASDGSAIAFKSDAFGKFSSPLSLDEHYRLLASKEGYFSGSNEVSTMGQRKHKTYEVTLELDTLVVGKPIVLRDIYYDFDKWDIRPDAEAPLNHLLQVLQDNPLIKIELSSHTDSRGRDAYNLTLSQKRAQSAVDYIISRGIDPTRIVAKGYGETKLVNACRNKVKCTEEEHQANRRTEFKVIAVDVEEVLD